MRQIRRPTPGTLALVVIAILAVTRLLNIQPGASGGASSSRAVRVAVVFDGDTFETDDGERVRLLGVDAPEVAHHDRAADPYGDESSLWLKGQILDKEVMLTFGPEPTDRYGRTLAWVYLSNDILVNRELLATGNAKLLDRYGLPLELESSLRQAEAAARTAGRGLWGK